MTEEHIEEIALKNIEMHQKIHIDLVASVNKILFTISTGVFVLSISFIGYLNVEIHHPRLLIACWIVFGAAIILNVTVLVLSSYVQTRMIRAINNHREKNFPPPWKMVGPHPDDKLTKFIVNINRYISILVFSTILTGMGLLITFATLSFNDQQDAKKIKDADIISNQKIDNDLKLIMTEKLRLP